MLRRSDDTELTLRDTVRHHFVAALATLETTARNRAKLLEDFYRYRASAIQEGASEPVKEYILPATGDASATGKLAGILMDHGIELKRATAPFRSAGREYAAGTYVVELAQPAKRLIRTLLDPQTAIDEHFLAAEETRRQMKQHSEIFDVTAWSLPLLFNVEAVASPAVSAGSFEPARRRRRLPPSFTIPQPAVAYLVPWGTQAAGRFLTGALRQNLKVSTSDRPFRQDTRAYPAGTLIFKTSQNPPGLVQTLQRLARETGVSVYGTDTGWVDDGVNFGSRYVVPVRKPPSRWPGTRRLRLPQPAPRASCSSANTVTRSRWCEPPNFFRPTLPGSTS